jgi:PAS domain S-box-containing protein
MIERSATWNIRSWRKTGWRVPYRNWVVWPGQGGSLRAHLMAVVIFVLIPSIGLTITIAVIADNAIEQSDRDRVREIATMLAHTIEDQFDRKDAMLSALIASSHIGDDANAKFARHARLIHGLSGEEVTLRWPPATVPDETLQSSADNTALAIASQALSTGRPVTSDVIGAPDSPMPVTMVVAPVIRQGHAIATVEAIVTADRLIGTLRRALSQYGGSAVLVDRSSRVAAATRDVARLVGQIYVLPNEMADLPPQLGGQGATLLASAELARPAGWRIYYRSAAKNSRIEGQLRDIAALGIVLSIAFAVVMALLLGTRLSHGLRALADLVRNVASGSKRVEAALSPLQVSEFEDLRLGIVRADAVLRRRGSAERMALREARTGHELLVSVVNGTAERIHVKDLELRYVLVNRAGLNVGPEPVAEWQVLGRAASDLFPPAIARRIEAADRRVLSTGRTTSFEQDYVHDATGQTMWLSMTIAPWEDAEGRVVGIVSVSRDITQQRQADARLRAIQADLLRATRLSAMGAMASGLAHELNQPLAAATNYLNASARLLDLAARGDAAVFPLARGAVTDAAQQMLRAGAIVRRLRDFVERGEVELRLEDTGDLLREACDLARSDGVTEGITLRSDIAADAESILVDRTQIQQVLLNLIRNAAEAIVAAEQDASVALKDPGEVVVSACYVPDGGMCIDVCDNGPGLSAGIAERLFEPFVSSKVSGMGIGLAICRTIIEGHGGTLDAQPNAICGMRFRITLPSLLSRGDLV